MDQRETKDMADEWEQNPPDGGTDQGQPQQNPADLNKRLEDVTRVVVQGASEAQQRIKRVVDRAGEYWQQTQTTPMPRQASNVEEQRIRQLANMWSNGNWRVARELGTYMDIVSWSTDEVWEVMLQTRWETRSMEMVTEPYAGRAPGKSQPVLPVWDYELPAVTGLKAPTTRARIDGLDEVLSCTVCNGTGRALCSTCTGRGWVICPDCKGRTKKRCTTCRGRGYIADWAEKEKRPFFKKQADNLAGSVTEKVADVFEGIRQQGVPIPNPVDTDPASKGKTVPCPDCVNGEMDCTCVTGKRVCATCQGAKTSLCANCGGTGKVVRHREMVRRFDLRIQTRMVGSSAIPEQQLQRATGDLVYNAEITEPLYAEAPPEGVPADVWRVAVELAKAASSSPEKSAAESAQASSRATLQVLELVRIPYTRVDYRYADQDYTFYVYDSEGKEKFYAQRFPARWDRIERLVRSITNDLMAPVQEDTPQSGSTPHGYRVPVEKPPYTITEEDVE